MNAPRSRFFRKLSWLLLRKRREEELAEELRFHLEQEAAERQAAGSPQDEARWAARRDLGNAGLAAENTRAAWGWTLLEQLIQDLRYAARAMIHNPAFTILAALSLALGIGANTAIYSFMDALLLRSLPVSDPQSLLVLNWHIQNVKTTRGTVMHSANGYTYNDPKTGKTSGIFPYAAFDLLRQPSALFSIVFAYYPTEDLNLVVRNQAEAAHGEYVSGGYFQGLALPPAAGRLILDDDDRTGAPPVAVLSFAFSQARFGDAASAVGQSILINNHPFTVAGVAPPGFFGVDPSTVPDFYLPIHANLLVERKSAEDAIAKRYLNRNYYWIEMMARLRPGVTRVQAQAALAPVFHRWVAPTAATGEERNNLPELLLQDGAGGLDKLRRRYSQPLYILLAMVGLILAIACANIANLLLARATARRRETAVRLGMGAGRWRVIRQLLTENLLLASLGGAAGILFAMWGVHFLTALLASGSDAFTLHADLNWRVLAVTATLSIATGLLFGLAPALIATRVDVMPVLKEVRGAGRRPRVWRFTLNQILVVSQMALSLLLLVAAGLFVRTLSNLQSVELGFARENVLLFTLNAQQAGHREPGILSFYLDLQKRFAAIPGVRSANESNAPLVGEGTWGSPVYPAGKPPLDGPNGRGSGMAATATHVLTTGPGFFTTMGIPMLAGREFDDRDGLAAPLVAIVNQAWAKVNLDGQNPIGQRVVSLGPGPKPQEMEIVGVVKNARYGDVSDDFPATVYFPFAQNSYYPVEQMTFALRAAGDPLAYANTVRQIVHLADPRVPVTNIRTQAAQIDQTMNQEILFARLCTGFAILALLIACVGLYGTMSYMVARRTGEIGIRMALGARRRGVIWMVMRQGIAMAGVGLAIGIPVALASSRLLESQLFGIRANDPVALLYAVAMLVVAVIAAGYAPARRASRIDPVTALRHE